VLVVSFLQQACLKMSTTHLHIVYLCNIVNGLRTGFVTVLFLICKYSVSECKWFLFMYKVSLLKIGHFAAVNYMLYCVL